jgi:hypothetical protein
MIELSSVKWRSFLSPELYFANAQIDCQRQPRLLIYDEKNGFRHVIKRRQDIPSSKKGQENISRFVQQFSAQAVSGARYMQIFSK